MEVVAWPTSTSRRWAFVPGSRACPSFHDVFTSSTTVCRALWNSMLLHFLILVLIPCDLDWLEVANQLVTRAESLSLNPHNSKKVTVISILLRKMFTLQAIDPCVGSQPGGCSQLHSIHYNLGSPLPAMLLGCPLSGLALTPPVLKAPWGQGLASILPCIPKVAPQHGVLADPVTDNPPPAPDSFLERFFGCN